MHRIISFKPGNYIEYLLLASHIMINRDFYADLVRKNRVTTGYPANIIFSELIIKDNIKFPFKQTLSNFDLTFL